MMGLKMYTGSGAKKSRSDSDKFKGWSEEDKQFDKFRLSFWFCPSSLFYVNLYGAHRATNRF
jgi:hypothetical protein